MNDKRRLRNEFQGQMAFPFIPAFNSLSVYSVTSVVNPAGYAPSLRGCWTLATPSPEGS